MPKAFNYEYSRTTSTIGSSQMLLSMETPIPLINILWVTCVKPERLQNVSFSLCYSERDWVSLPKFWNVIMNRPEKLSQILWADMMGFDYLRKLSYQMMPVSGFSSDLILEKLGYLEILRANDGISLCPAIYRMAKR